MFVGINYIRCSAHVGQGTRRAETNAVQKCENATRIAAYCVIFGNQLDDGWPESEKTVFQTALIMVVVQK